MPYSLVASSTSVHQSHPGRLGTNLAAAWNAAPALFRWLLRVDIALALAHLFSYGLFRRLLPSTVVVDAGNNHSAQYTFKWLSALFDLNQEANIPTWFSSMQLLMVGLLLGVFAHAKYDWRQRSASLGLVALSLLFVLLSLDEVACLHENLGGKLVLYLKAMNKSTGFILLCFWLAILLPFVGVMTCIVRCAWLHLRKHPTFVWRFGVSLIAFLAFAVGCELAWVALFGGDPSDSLVEVVIEEAGEMIAVTFMVRAVWELLRSEKISLNFAPTQASQQQA